MSKYILWGAGSLFFAYQFILRMSVGILREDIMSKFNVDLIAFGSLAGWYYLGYSGMQVPIGILLDKFRPKSIALLSIAICILGVIAFLGNSWSMVLFGRFLIGIGSASAILFCVKVTIANFEHKYHSVIIGFAVTIGLIGAIWGGMPMKVIFENFGYKNTFVGLILVGVVLFGVIALIKDDTNLENQNDSPTLSEIFKNVLLNPVVLFTGICGGLMVGSLEGFADVWGMPFFKDVFGFSEYEGIELSSMVFLGMCVGGPIVPFVMNMFNNDTFGVFIIGIMTCAVYAVLFLVKNLSFFEATALMCFLGMLCQYQVLVFNIVADIIGQRYAGVGIALTNCLNMSFGYIFHKVISLIISANWDGAVDALGKAVYNYDTYLYGISSIPIACFIGQFGFLYVGRFVKK